MRLTCKKLCASFMAGVLAVGILWNIPSGVVPKQVQAAEAVIDTIPGTVRTEKDLDGSFLSVTGFAKGNVKDRSEYEEGMEEYAVVTNVMEFFEAIDNAQNGIVKVIELRCDLNLGWNELPEDVIEEYGDSLIEPYKSSLVLAGAPVSNPSMIESGISCLTLNSIDGLTIFSTTGHTIRHVETKLNATVNDLVIRNLKFDDVWDWDDQRSSGYGSTGQLGTAKRTGWSFIKINGAKNIWIDHCDFGVSYDGNVDIENGSRGISITWCHFEDTDYSKGSMLYKTIAYMEELYQQNKENPDVGRFIIYGIMRDNGMSLEDIAKYMGYHKKCHLGGGGESDSWWFDKQTEKLLDKPDYTRDNANEYLRMSYAYNSWINMGSRIPMLRGGVGHLYNCYLDNTKMKEAGSVMYAKNEAGKSIVEQISDAGGSTHFMSRGMNPLLGASIAADTNVYRNFDEPIIGGEHDGETAAARYGYNHALIVNSKISDSSGAEYIGSSWDKDGVNPFTKSYSWKDKSTLNHWSWGQEGDELPYDYQTFPLDDVEKNVKTYGGAYTIDMSASDWLKVEYSADMPLKTVDRTKEVPIETLSLTKTDTILFMQEEFLQLDARVTPSHTTETAADFTWVSSDPNVARVNDCGLVIPQSIGETTITVTTAKGLSASCRVTVANLPTGMVITNIPDQVYAGDIVQFGADLLPGDLPDESVVWESNSQRAQVIDADNGIFQFIKEGTAMIQAIANLTGNRAGNESGKIKSANIKVQANPVPVIGVDVVSTCALQPGETGQLQAKTVPENATNPKLVYAVSDASVAAVSQDGTVSALAEGETVVTITSVNGGYQAACIIKVEKADIEEPEPEVQLGDVTGDQRVTLEDAQLVLKFALKINSPTKEQQVAADVNQDNQVALEDAQLVLKYALKIISEFE